MNTLEAQKAVIELLSLVYSKAAVVVGGQNAPMPSVPYVVVSFGAATKAPGQSAFLNVVDGKEVPVERILKNGTNYVKIRDVAAALGLEVGNQGNVAVLRRKES